MPEKMSEQEYISVLNSYEADARRNNTKYVQDSAELLRRYKGEPYGDEKDERSKVISNDVMDVVEADMPSLARIFLGVNKICTFRPGPGGEEDLREAKQKTEYVDWIVRQQRDSFTTQFSFLKDIISQKMGALKWIMEDHTEEIEHSFEDMSGIEVSQKMEELKKDEVKSVKITERGETTFREGDPETERFQGKITVITNTRRAKIIGVPLESLLFSSGASDPDDANLVGDRVEKTRGELLKQFPNEMDKIKQLNLASDEQKGTLPQLRLDDQGGVIQDDGFRVWANQRVEICDLYVMVDKKGDGISQRRHILKSGNIILEDEQCPQVPYAITSAILMPHSITGLSRAELAAPTAKIQTAVKRGILDNIYAVNAPQIGVNDNVNHDDLLTKRPNGLVRVKGKENPGSSIFSFNVEYIGQQALQVSQHFDQSMSKTTGNLIASQGLSSDTFEKETATRFDGMKEQGAEKMELVVRCIAENAYKRMYNGLADMLNDYQTTDTEIMVLGEPMTVNPKNWKHKHEAISTLGLGASDGTKKVETLTGILNIQMQFKASGSPLVDEVKIFNTVDSILKASDVHDTSAFFNNPEVPDQLLKAENEIMKRKLEEAQQIIEGQQNPLLEPEIVKAKSKAQTDQLKARTDMIKVKSGQNLGIAKLQEEKRQFDISTTQDAKKTQMATVLELTKLEAETGEDIPGSSI